MKAVVRKEFSVAFSKRSQPVWFRALKWALFIPLTIFMYTRGYFWPWIIGLFALSMSLHFFYRWKTRGWTQPYGLWDDVQAGEE